MPIQRVANPEVARRYLLDELSVGTTLAKLVASRIDFAGGQYLFDLSQVLDQSALDFRSGNLRFQKNEATAFAQLVKTFIANPQCAVLLQETMMEASELAGFEYAPLAVFHGAEIYWRIIGAQMAVQ